MGGKCFELATQMLGVMHPRQDVALDFSKRRERIKTEACEQGEHECLVVEVLQELRHWPYELADGLDEKAAEQECRGQRQISKNEQHGERYARCEAVGQPAPIIIAHQIRPEDRPQPS